VLNSNALVPSAASFTDRLKHGLAGESLIARWLLRRGWTILPAYEKFEMNFKGPRLLAADGDLISPDMLVFRYGERAEVHWIEAKTKTAFTWFRDHGRNPRWQDGIDKRCWMDYLKVSRLAPWPVWLMFLHGPGGIAKDTPEGMIPPTGLFGNTVANLTLLVDHSSDRFGPTGMVYWNIADLLRICTWEEVASLDV
jgi:hypothetical protein